jgi:hypothetical protein
MLIRHFGDIMKKLSTILEVLPHLLLVSMTPYVIILLEANIAQAIIISALSALCGYILYLRNNRQPNHVEIFNKQLTDMGLELRKEIELAKKDSKDLKEKYGKMTVEAQKRKNVDNKFSW